MGADSSFGNTQLPGKYAIRLAFRKVAKHLALSVGETRQRRHVHGKVERPGLCDRSQVKSPPVYVFLPTRKTAQQDKPNTSSAGGGQSPHWMPIELVSLLAV
ncbi:hypothetical protein ACIBQ5_13250 [Streptomyces massasporeus]|uniref:hypothetical protein n=1 Tax=Streptomyces massasporeus TaxID=67324 RepID=UPI0037A46E6F